MGLILLVLSFFNSANAQLAEGYRILDSDKKYIESFKRPEIVIDHVNFEGYEVYGPAGLGEYLTNMNIPHATDTAAKDADGADHPTAEIIEAQINEVVNRCSGIMQLVNIGKTVKGKNQLFVKVSDNPTVDETEPEFKYISSMHGDEITGRDMMMRLLNDICDNYNKDTTITDLVNNTEIYIMPSMNPDGSNARQRWNANGVDLNRNFPDFSVAGNDQNTTAGRAIETQNIMNFQASRQIALSVNMHGGAEVMNYVWDTIPQDFEFHNLVVELSLGYTKLVPYIYNSGEFSQGITNGYAWYEVDGGMQDWSYYWHNDLQFTLELSTTKWAPFSQMSTYYQANRPAFLYFISAVHQGTGFKFDDKNTEGVVELVDYNTNKSLGKFNFVRGEFYKVLDIGKYKMIVSPKKGTERTVYSEVTGASLNTNNYIPL